MWWAILRRLHALKEVCWADSATPYLMMQCQGQHLQKQLLQQRPLRASCLRRVKLHVLEALATAPAQAMGWQVVYIAGSCHIHTISFMPAVG